MKSYILFFFILLNQLCMGQEYHKVKVSKSMELYDAIKFKRHEDFFKIDTIKDKKVVIYDVQNKKKCNNVFDSIAFNKFFIIGYKKQIITVYNYTIKKLKLSGLRAVRLDKHFPVAYIIQYNKLKNINLIGTKNKRGDGPLGMALDEMPGNNVSLEINQKEGQFYLHSDYLYDLLNKAKFSSLEMEFKVYHVDDVIETEYADNIHKINIYSPGLGSIKYPFLIYTKLKNGKYNLNTIDYLISENPSPEVEKENAILPKNLDKISKNIFYKVEKNGLSTYYPLVKEIKYKELGDFDYNNTFARFELPNGQKGWLSSDGKEYLDE